MRVLLMLAVAVCLGGCGRGPTFASVEGVVRLDGKPLADAEVQFIPDITQGATGPPASAYTDKDGRFRIAATDASGVVVGQNRVCVNDARAMMPGGGDAESGVPVPGQSPPPRRPRVPTVYADATRSPLGAIDIRPGSQSVPLELKSRP